MILLLLWQFVGGTTSQEEGLDENSDINHVRGGMVESRDNHVRGDNILPESDYDYSQFIPIHNDFTDYDSDQTPGDDGVYEDPNCWSPQCAGESGGGNIMCMACPDTRPVRDGMEENSDHVRADNILPEVDYDYSQLFV